MFTACTNKTVLGTYTGASSYSYLGPKKSIKTSSYVFRETFALNGTVGQSSTFVTLGSGAIQSGNAKYTVNADCSMTDGPYWGVVLNDKTILYVANMPEAGWDSGEQSL